ncbi:hypothetical protein COP2_009066 [Malus domestica]
MFCATQNENLSPKRSFWRGTDQFPSISLDLFFQTSQVDPSRDDTFGNDGVPAFKTSEGEGQNEELGRNNLIKKSW